MTVEFPEPGRAYKIRDLVGGGKWKTAYRATDVLQARDVALLYSNGTEGFESLKNDMESLLRVQTSGHPGSRHIAEFFGLHMGEDGRPYLVEEFLIRPLSKASPLDDLRRFYEVARDLCAGLACIHQAMLLHRDIKLDNCGLDHGGRAKLFDLGSLTSDFESVKGNIYTRPPEVFALKSPKEGRVGSQDTSADVWSLGATLFALRTGQYPFISAADYKLREEISRKVSVGELDSEQGNERKLRIEKKVELSILAAGAQQTLFARIEDSFPSQVADLVRKMLEFNPQMRPTAESCSQEWGKICLSHLNMVNSVDPHDASYVDSLFQLVLAAKNSEFYVTYSQCDELSQEISKLKRSGHLGKSEAEIEEMERAIIEIKDRVAKRKEPAFAG